MQLNFEPKNRKVQGAQNKTDLLDKGKKRGVAEKNSLHKEQSMIEKLGHVANS